MHPQNTAPRTTLDIARAMLPIALVAILLGCAQQVTATAPHPLPIGEGGTPAECTVPTDPLPPQGSTAGPAATPDRKRSYVDAAVSSEERLTLEALLEESEAIWASPEFAKNLSSLGTTYPTTFVASGVKRDAKSLLDLMTGVSGEQRVPAAVTLVGDRNYFFALTGATGDGKTASMALGRGNLYINWVIKDEVHRSCGINTVVHEMSHLIFAGGKPVEHGSQLVQDQGAAAGAAPGDAVASYLIGTVAQCTWLQKRSRVSPEGLQDCIAVFGHRGFNSLRCDKFSNGEPVKPRNGLPPEHVIQ